jgi:DNA-binding NtrC family response regulator
MRRFERETIAAALARAKGKINGPGGAAEVLGMKPSTLTSRMKAMAIARPILEDGRSRGLPAEASRMPGESDLAP